MKSACAVGLWLLALSGVALARQKEFGWVRANKQVTQLDPADFRAGRVYHPRRKVSAATKPSHGAVVP
jgi:hypothetical protein